MSVVTPILFAAIPILMGNAIGGSNAEQTFSKNTNIAGSFAGYMLIGALMFQLVSNTLWNFGFWLRREQMTGTLESGVYLVPTSRFWLVLGSSLYVLVRNSVSFVLALIFGLIIFSVQIGDFLKPTIILAILFLAIGLPPIVGLSLLIGGIILKFKEIGSFINMLQWIISFLMGIFYPITLFPLELQIVAYLFPPTWTAIEIRSSLYNITAMSEILQNFIVSLGFAIIVPILAFLIWFKVEKGILNNQGVGFY